MRRELLDFDLPEELIATRPPEERDGARLLVVDRGRPPGEVEHGAVRELDERLPPGALLVVNDTRVLPARLLGRREPTGGAVELLLLSPRASGPEGERWACLGRSSKPLRPGTVLKLGEGAITAVGERCEAIFR